MCDQKYNTAVLYYILWEVLLMQSITIIIISHAASSSAQIMASTMSHIICHTSSQTTLVTA